MHARQLVARHLRHHEAGTNRGDVHRRLDLEPPRHGDPVDAVAPEGVEAVAEVRVPRPEEQVRDTGERTRPHAAQRGEIVAAALPEKARALRHVGAGHERLDEPGDLGRIRRAVAVDGHHDVAGRGREPERERGALTVPGLLLEHARGGPQAPGDRDGRVGRAPVDEDQLVHVARQPRDHARQIPLLVECRNHDVAARRAGCRPTSRSDRDPSCSWERRRLHELPPASRPCPPSRTPSAVMGIRDHAPQLRRNLWSPRSGGLASGSP